MKFLAPLSSLATVLSAAQAEEGAERKSRVPVFVRGSAKSGSYGYCTWSPDTSCYSSGWPACCAVNGGRDCPRERPGCDRNHAGYCTWAPNYSCYTSGWPRCCFNNAGHDCPTVQPGCDKSGASYCVWAPDYSCYESGWPGCCAENGGRDCPPGQPVCDRVGASYCVWSPDYSCYASGWPECCATNEGRDCPDEQPGCNIGVDDCAEMGATAAELVVLNNWCQPGSPGTSPFRTPNYVAQCKEVATSICEGQIYGVAQRWCADEAMSTSEMLSLQNECEDQVDGMLPGAELALKVE